MENNKKTQKLSRQIIRIVLFSMTAIILFQIAAVITILRDNEMRRREAAEASAVSIAASLDVVGHNLIGLGRFLSNYEAFRRLFLDREEGNPAPHVAAAFHTVRYMSDHFPMIRDVIVIPTVGTPLSFYPGRDYEFERVLEAILASHDFSDPSYISSQFLYFEGLNYFAYMTPISNIITTEVMRQRHATCIIVIDKDFISALFDQGDARYHFTRYSVYDSTKRLITSSTEDLPLNNEAYFISVEAYAMGLTVRAYDVLFATEGVVALIIYLIYFSVLILLVVMLLVILQLNKKITYPISELVLEMKTWKGASLKKRLKNSNIYEIDQLVEGFNLMLSEIETNTRQIFHTQEKLYEMEVRKNETEVYALQSQINPHFLFNTLQCIRSIAIMEQVDSIAKITLSMSEMLRYAMDYQEEVLIRDEIEIIRHYELICNIRFQNKFKFILDLDPCVLDYGIGRMTLQPLVENAVIHGVSKMEEKGYIRISGGVITDKEQIWIKIEDNGPGIERDRLSQIESELQLGFAEALQSEKSHSFGLYNINRRLKLLYGNDHCLSIQSHDGGTIVTIHVPASPRLAKFTSEYFTKNI